MQTTPDQKGSDGTLQVGISFVGYHISEKAIYVITGEVFVSIREKALSLLLVDILDDCSPSSHVGRRWDRSASDAARAFPSARRAISAAGSKRASSLLLDAIAIRE